MPKVYKNVIFPTREESIVDQINTNIPAAFKGQTLTQSLSQGTDLEEYA